MRNPQWRKDMLQALQHKHPTSTIYCLPPQPSGLQQPTLSTCRLTLEAMK